MGHEFVEQYATPAWVAEDVRAPLLDVHFIDDRAISDTWWDLALESFETAANGVDWRVELQWAEVVPGNVWEARRRAFALGTAPYATNLDPDDWMTADALHRVHAGMLAGAPAILTQGRLHRADGTRANTFKGMLVVRRDVLASFDWTPRACCPTCAMIAELNPLRVPAITYHRRVGYGSRQQTAIDRERAHAVG